MKLTKTITIAYVMYSLYALMILDVTSLITRDILPAILMMWFIYVVFNLGYRTNKINEYSGEIIDHNYRDAWILNSKKSTLLAISVLSVIAAVLAANFYTGQTPNNVISGLLNENRSLYSEYQLHARVNNTGAFTLNKIPYILMMFYTKLMLFYCGISFLLIKGKTSIYEKLCLTLIFMAHIYFGVARGTNYELFEIVILLIFITMSNKKKNKTFKKVFIIVSVIGIMIYLFYARISDRGVVFDYNSIQHFVYNPNGIISYLFQDSVFVIMLLYNYFGFGFYYISTFMMGLWMNSISGFISALIPMGYVISENQSLQELISKKISIGTRWHPDVMIMINNYGFPIFIVIVFFMGIFTKYLMKQEKTALSYLTQFMILMQMISFPTGNFVFVSSASTLVVLLLLVIWGWKLTINKRIKISQNRNLGRD